MIEKNKQPTGLPNTMDRINNGYVISEMDKVEKENDIKNVYNEVAASTMTFENQTTTIFNYSTDITIGNKTFISGTFTIKQYIEEPELNKSK